MFNISQFRAGFAQVRSGLQVIEDQLVCALAAPSGFAVDAVRMETTDWISSTVNWADSPTGSMFVWLKITPATGAYMAIFGPSTASDLFGINNYDGSGSGYIYDSTESNFVYATPAAATYAEDIWLPCFMDWKADETAGNKILQMYLGDTSVAGTVSDDGTASFTVPWSGATLNIGKAGFTSQFDGDMAEFWLSMTRLDFSVEANRRKFLSATGKPVDVGTDGSTPTGSAPEVYLSVRPGDAAADFVTNRGTGNNFTQNGSLGLASTSPSD